MESANSDGKIKKHSWHEAYFWMNRVIEGY